MLSDDRRRATVEVLSGRTTPVDLDVLAERVAVVERDSPGPLADRIEQVTIELHHVHLPLLDELGLVNYCPELTRVE